MTAYKEAVVAIIGNVYGNVLSVTRPGRERERCFPGGKVEPGETLLQALVREVYEEPGIEVLVATLLFTDRVPGEVTFDTSCFLVESWRGFAHTKEHGVDVQWAPIRDFLDPSAPFAAFNIKALRAARDWSEP